MMFNTGDKVKRANGLEFSNGELVVTVESHSGNTVHLKETKTWLNPSELVLATPTNKISEVIKQLRELATEKKNELDKLESAISVLEKL